MALERIGKDTLVYRAYELRYGYHAFNPGTTGCSRFAPFHDASGALVPTLYGAVAPIPALLESIFHEVHHDSPDRIIYKGRVRNWGLVAMRLPRDVALVDLRDRQLAELGLDRAQIVATSAAHYACTQEWARWLHDQQIGRQSTDGILWQSRQTELCGHQDHDDEVLVLFGDRVRTNPGDFPLAGPGVRNLVEGPGFVMLERIAEHFGARIEPDDM